VNKEQFMRFAYGKMWGGLAALVMLYAFVVIVAPMLDLIGELGTHSVLGAILSLGFIFGWLAALIIVPVYIATHLKYKPKAK
jgi:hypothetical protein